MPSPFPGMDPYLEDPARWGGVHQGLVYAVHAELNRVLPAGYVAELDLYVWARDEPDGKGVAFARPDVFVPERARRPAARSPAGVTATAPPSAVTRLPRRQVKRRGYVRVVATDAGSRVVTVVEVLSPANKDPGPDRDTYLGKRREYFAGGVNLVEVDLLRAGPRLPMGRPDPPAADYYVVVSPADDAPTARVWAFTVREPIPVFPVPLARPDPDVPLDLRRCLDRVYDDGRYPDKANYARPPVPPLSRPDAEWAAGLLAKHAKKRKR